MMIKMIKRLSTQIQLIKAKIELIDRKITKAIDIAKRCLIGVVTYLVVFAIFLSFNNTTNNQSSVLKVLTDNEIENLSLSNDELLSPDDTSCDIVEEKIANDKYVIFSDEESIMYCMEETPLSYGPEIGKYDTYTTLPSGTEIKVLGFNEFNTAKLDYDNLILYVDGSLLTNNKDYIFNDVDSVIYAKNDIKAYNNLEGATGADIEIGSELHLIGTNDSSYSKIELDGRTYYVNKSDISESTSYVFEDENKTMYARGRIGINRTQDEDSEQLVNIESGDTVQVIGTNDSGFYKVIVDDIKGYVKTDKLTANKSDIYPFLTLSTHSNMKYNPDNALGGIVATVDPSWQTEENVYLLAKIIYCEARGEGYDGQRAVGTVVINRAFDGTMGSDIYSVIYRPGQFSPVASGEMSRVYPSEECIEAARDVLMNGYRSFPAYVLYFQSIRDGYFSGQSTYLTSYADNGSWPQYFSYKWSDYQKYCN